MDEIKITAEEDANLLSLIDRHPTVEDRVKEIKRIAKRIGLSEEKVSGRTYMLKRLPEREKRRIRKMAKEDPKYVVELGTNKGESKIVNVYFPGRLPRQLMKAKLRALSKEDEMVSKHVSEGGMNDELKDRIEEWRKTLSLKGPLAVQLNSRVLASLIAHSAAVYSVPVNEVIKKFCYGSNGLKMREMRAKLERGTMD